MFLLTLINYHLYYVLQPQLQALSYDDNDDRSDGKYEDNSDDYNTDSQWYKTFKQLSLIQC